MHMSIREGLKGNEQGRICGLKQVGSCWDGNCVTALNNACKYKTIEDVALQLERSTSKLGSRVRVSAGMLNFL